MHIETPSGIRDTICMHLYMLLYLLVGPIYGPTALCWASYAVLLSRLCSPLPSVDHPVRTCPLARYQSPVKPDGQRTNYLKTPGFCTTIQPTVSDSQALLAAPLRQAVPFSLENQVVKPLQLQHVVIWW